MHSSAATVLWRVTLVGRMMAPHVVMSEIATSLSRIMDRPVVDQTGLAGILPD